MDINVKCEIDDTGKSVEIDFILTPTCELLVCLDHLILHAHVII